jgi:hypothetical protein
VVGCETVVGEEAGDSGDTGGTGGTGEIGAIGSGFGAAFAAGLAISGFTRSGVGSALATGTSTTAAAVGGGGGTA